MKIDLMTIKDSFKKIQEKSHYKADLFSDL